jgi:hypothetical protein
MVVPIPVVAVTVLGPGGVGPQPMAQIGTLLLGHDHEIELNLLDANDRAGSPVDPLGQLLGAGPGGHGQGHLYLHTAAARPYRSDQAELTERQADFGIADRADCGLQL